jgi:hypothetical protein
MLSPGPEDVLGPAAGAILAGSPKMIKKFMDVTDELLKKSPLRKSEKWVKKQLDPIVSKKVHHLGEYDPTVELWKERTGTRADPFGTHRRQPDIGEFGETGADVPMPRQTQTTVRQTGTESPIGGRAGTTKHEIEHLLTQEYTSPEDFRRWGAVGGGRSKDMAHPRVKEMTGFDKMTGPQVADETRSMLMQELNTEGAPIRATREQLEILGQEVDIDLFADEDVMKRWRPQSMEDLVPLQQSGWTGSKKEVSQKIKDAFAGVGLKL